MNDLRDFVTISSALADEGRVRALAALRGGELCVCQIVELLDLSSSTVSKHLSILRQAGLLDWRKEGRWSYYRLPDQPSQATKHAIQWAIDSIQSSNVAVEDTKRIKEILKMDPEELCKCQAKRSKCCSSAPAIRVAARWLKVGQKS